MPFVEISILILAVITAMFELSPLTAKETGFWGVIIIILSYIHFVIAGTLGAWIVSLTNKPKINENNTPSHRNRG